MKLLHKYMKTLFTLNLLIKKIKAGVRFLSSNNKLRSSKFFKDYLNILHRRKD